MHVYVYTSHCNDINYGVFYIWDNLIDTFPADVSHLLPGKPFLYAGNETTLLSLLWERRGGWLEDGFLGRADSEENTVSVSLIW